MEKKIIDFFTEKGYINNPNPVSLKDIFSIYTHIYISGKYTTNKLPDIMKLFVDIAIKYDANISNLTGLQNNFGDIIAKLVSKGDLSTAVHLTLLYPNQYIYYNGKVENPRISTIKTAIYHSEDRNSLKIYIEKFNIDIYTIISYTTYSHIGEVVLKYFLCYYPNISLSKIREALEENKGNNGPNHGRANYTSINDMMVVLDDAILNQV